MEYDFEDAPMTCRHAPGARRRICASPGDAMLTLSIRAKPAGYQFLMLPMQIEFVRSKSRPINSRILLACLIGSITRRVSSKGELTGIRPLRRSGANPKCPQKVL
jgi:hypothetical protein